jgi:thiazole synthase
MSGQLEIAGRKFSSRLLLGTGKFSSNEVMRDALAASGTEIVTVALRRADISGRRDPYANILDFIDPVKYLLLPNTSGAFDATELVKPRRPEPQPVFKVVKLESIPIRNICARPETPRAARSW